jgi:hypothetical protein
MNPILHETLALCTLTLHGAHMYRSSILCTSDQRAPVYAFLFLVYIQVDQSFTQK